MTMFDGTPDTQFSLYPQPQREAIYAFQKQYGAVRVLKVEGTTDIELEALDGTQKRRVVASMRVKEDGCPRH